MGLKPETKHGMRLILRSIMIGLLALACPCCPAASTPLRNNPPASRTVSFGQGLFWKITRPPQPASYLYGTMHLDSPAVTHLPPLANMAFARARILIAEVSLDPAAQGDYAQAGRLPTHQHLGDMLPAADYAALLRIAAGYGADATLVDRMKPWLATNLIGRPRPHSGVVLDELLQQRARDMGKPVVYLETLAELTAKLEQLPLAVQLEILGDTIAQHALIMREQTNELAAYLREDTEALLAGTTRPHHDEAAFKQFNDVMLHQRTTLMLRRMLPELTRGNAFIGVGAAHLPGSHGLLRQIEHQGFTVLRMSLR